MNACFHHSLASSRRAFSLIELLVVITIIGVIAAVMAPNIGFFRDKARLAAERENAMNLAKVCSAAQASGLDFIQGDTDVSLIVPRIVQGGEVSSGSLKGYKFRLSGLSAAEQAAASQHLEVKGGVLIFVNPD